MNAAQYVLIARPFWRKAKFFLPTMIFLISGFILTFFYYHSGLGFSPLYPGESLSSLNYTSSEVQTSSQDGVQLIVFSLTSPEGRITISEQADSQSEAFDQFNQQQDKETFETKWGPAILLHGSIASLHTASMTLFAQTDRTLAISDWQNIFNALTYDSK